jgi:hypothetical protein
MEIWFGKSNTTLSSSKTAAQMEKRRERLLTFVPLSYRKMNHIFFDWPSVTIFWKHKSDILNNLLGPHPLWRKLAYCTSTPVPLQLPSSFPSTYWH